jgi:hypothetical protein
MVKGVGVGMLILTWPILAAVWTSRSTLDSTAQLCLRNTQSSLPQQHWSPPGWLRLLAEESISRRRYEIEVEELAGLAAERANKYLKGYRRRAFSYRQVVQW